MKILAAVSIATIYGLSVRMMFGFLDNVLGIMTISFLMVVPFIVGFLTVWFLPKVESKLSAFFMPWATSIVVLLVTIFFNIEGTICWLMIFPVFAVFAGIGGLVALGAKTKRQKRTVYRDTLDISVALLIPVVCAAVEGDRSLQPKEYTIKKEVLVDAPKAKVWEALTHVGTIAPEEKHTPLSSFIGFPQHLKTTLEAPRLGAKRMAYYEKGLYFEETITQLEAERLLVLDIKTDPYKIPPTVMDEHIVIGGKHLDILQDVYELEALPEGGTKVTLSSKFYINTPFNWYAGLWAEYLMEDLLGGELQLLKSRATKSGTIDRP